MKLTYSLGVGSLAGLALAASVIPSTRVGAESLVEQVVDTRLVLAFRVDPAELQKVVPGPWEIAGTAAGPAQNANFNVIFYEDASTGWDWRIDGAVLSLRRLLLVGQAEGGLWGGQRGESDLRQRSEARSGTIQEQPASKYGAPQRH
jgi:hypothetical protein